MLDGDQTIASRRREERRRVLLPARMRSGLGWSDACILNISPRGLLVYSKGSAEPGSFVELRRGSQLVVARVMWRQNQRIGLSSPDPIPVASIVSNEAVDSAVQLCGSPKLERRRLARSHDSSRSQGRGAEFVALLVIATLMAGASAAYVQQALAKPLTQVRAALGSN